MAVWVVRAGKRGEQEAEALSSGNAVIGWNELPDLSDIKTKDHLKRLVLQCYPTRTQNSRISICKQLWAFRFKIKAGDLIALPSKLTKTITVGIVSGSYKFISQGNCRHAVPVKWIHPNLERHSFDQDIQASLQAPPTVSPIRKENAERRIRLMLAKDGHSGQSFEKDDPAYDGENTLQRLRARYHGHGFAEVVEHVLRAQGFTTLLSKPGVDGGVDILAGSGIMGFGSIKLAVQVKSTEAPVDELVVRQLQRAMTRFKATHGLVMSVNGFTKRAVQEGRDDFFALRLWDGQTLVQNMMEVRDQLPVELRCILGPSIAKCAPK